MKGAMIMKKCLTVILAGLMLLLIGCSNGNTAKEATTSEIRNETSFPAGNTETDKPQKSKAVESNVPVTEKESENTLSSAQTKNGTQATSSESNATENKKQETTQKSAKAKSEAKQETTSKQNEQEKAKEEPAKTPKPTEPKKETFDVSGYVEYAKSYAQSIGLSLDSTAIACWDNPITANSRRNGIKDDIKSRLNRYKNIEGFTAVWVWAEKVTDTEYEIYIGYC